MVCTETLQLLEGLQSYRHQQIRKAKEKKMLNIRCGSSLRKSVERPCGYQGDNLAGGTVRPSHESLQERLLVSFPGHEVLHRVIDNDALLNRPEIVHT